MDVYARIKELGYEVPATPKPVASYVVAKQVGNIVYSSGQTGTVQGELTMVGKLGDCISIEESHESARISLLNCLAAIESVIGDLNKIAEIVRLTGFVASASGFVQQPMVVEGASKFLLDIFDEKGQHARSAIGVAELPFGAPVELELIVRIEE